MVRDGIYKKNSLFDEQTERAFPVGRLNPDAFPALNVGGKSLVSSFYSFDKLFYRNAVGRALSFATLSVWSKPQGI
jgi:hypothetical protein